MDDQDKKAPTIERLRVLADAWQTGAVREPELAELRGALPRTLDIAARNLDFADSMVAWQQRVWDALGIYPHMVEIDGDETVTDETLAEAEELAIKQIVEMRDRLAKLEKAARRVVAVDWQHGEDSDCPHRYCDDYCDGGDDCNADEPDGKGCTDCEIATIRALHKLLGKETT